MYYQFFDCPTLSVLLLQENQMNTTAQTMNEINDLISLIQQNKKPYQTLIILGVKEKFSV